MVKSIIKPITKQKWGRLANNASKQAKKNEVSDAYNI